MLKVITLGHPGLRQRAETVTEINEGVRHLSTEMLAIMKQHRGVGLAATQVNKMLRIFVTKAPEDKERVFINPELIHTSINTDSAEEGCLSIPGPRSLVKRSIDIRIQAWGHRGRPFVMEAAGMLARIIQHELDHLNGVLFIDHISVLERERVLNDYEKNLEQRDSEADHNQCE